MKVEKRYSTLPICCVCKKHVLHKDPYWFSVHHNIVICFRCAPFETEKEAEGFNVCLDTAEDWVNMLKEE